METIPHCQDATTIQTPVVPMLAKRRRSPPGREKLDLFIPKNQNILPCLEENLIFFCLVMKLFLKATYSPAGAAQPRRGRRLQPTASVEAPELQPQSTRSPGLANEEPLMPNPTSNHCPALLNPDGET